MCHRNQRLKKRSAESEKIAVRKATLMMLRNALRRSIVLVAILPGVAAADEESQQLAREATALLKARCYTCHGETFNGNAQFNVLDSPALLEHQYVLPDDVENSPVWQRVAGNEMPPEDSGVAPLTDDERVLLKRWIAAGAPQVQRERRNFKAYSTLIDAVYTDLERADAEDRVYLRYFSLAHLSNNYQEVTDFDLRLYRAAFSKAINSLSVVDEVYVPTFVDDEQTIFRVDIRRLGWTSKQWSHLLDSYPFGIHFHHADDSQLANRDRQIDDWSGTPTCWIRADWFINSALRPPLYEQLLNIPDTLDRLETHLNVDAVRNFREDRLARAGFATSGVSNGNRLVERHSSRDGYYWKSYDFTGRTTDGNLFRFPLGPKFAENEFANLAFQHDGGEMIFSLPNGLQAYMLCDASGKRIDKGPIEVVRDTKEIGGTPEVINGLSCIHCHRHGMIDFRDSVRDGAGVFDAARRKVHRLYPEPAAMSELVAKDRVKFMAALSEAIGPFLQVGDDRTKPIEEFAEPVGAIARFYQRDLTLAAVACEMGFENPEVLRELIQHNRELVRLGLGPLVGGQTIKRAAWDSNAAFVSPFQEAMRALGKATPVN